MLLPRVTMVENRLDTLLNKHSMSRIRFTLRKAVNYCIASLVSARD